MLQIGSLVNSVDTNAQFRRVHFRYLKNKIKIRAPMLWNIAWLSHLGCILSLQVKNGRKCDVYLVEGLTAGRRYVRGASSKDGKRLETTWHLPNGWTEGEETWHLPKRWTEGRRDVTPPKGMDGWKKRRHTSPIDGQKEEETWFLPKGWTAGRRNLTPPQILTDMVKTKPCRIIIDPSFSGT